MQTYPIKDTNGVQFGFAIDVVYIRLNTIAKLLSSVHGVSDLKRRRLFDFGNECHIEFDFHGEKFAVWEPYGDNSRYSIVPMEPGEKKTDISSVEEVFVEYKPAFFVRLLGDLLTLNFKGLFR